VLYDYLSRESCKIARGLMKMAFSRETVVKVKALADNNAAGEAEGDLSCKCFTAHYVGSSCVTPSSFYCYIVLLIAIS